MFPSPGGTAPPTSENAKASDEPSSTVASTPFPHTIELSIVARDTDGFSVALSLDLEGIACSVGSACTSASTEVSHVLSAMGYPDEEARGALRLSLGRTTTDAEIDVACEVVPRVIASMRAGSAAVAADPLGQGVTV